MNQLNFNQVGGFPLSTNILNELQKAYTVFNSLGNIVGDLTIISGCEVTGGNVANGVVFINGEVLEFQGGSIQTKVIIKEDVEELIFEDGNSKPVIKTRYAKFGTGVVFYTWADFKRGTKTGELPAIIESFTERLDALELRASIPIDMIALWGRPANEIPAGWEEYALLTGKMPIGFDAANGDFDVVLKTGGSKTHTLTVAEMPSHSHEMKYGSAGTDANNQVKRDSDGDNYLGITSTEDTGGGEAFNIMNPFRVVHFIQYKGV